MAIAGAHLSVLSLLKCMNRMLRYKYNIYQLTKEIMAARRRILTRRSSNCSKISSHKGLPVAFKSEQINTYIKGSVKPFHIPWYMSIKHTNQLQQSIPGSIKGQYQLLNMLNILNITSVWKDCMDLSVQYIIITNPVKYQIAKNLILTQNDQHEFRIPFPIQKNKYC